MSAYSSYDYCFLKSAPSTANKEQSELQNQCYYHGMIKRVEVLRLLKNNGDFLVRDSISHPGGYVLTGFCHSKPVHFEINRSEEGMFHFEDEKFGSIVDLIEFYHAHRKEVTSNSGFILGSPVLNSNSKASNWNNVGRVEDGLEIEAAYAPYFGKVSARAPSLQTLNRALGHKAVLNEVKKRWKEEFKSEQDIYHRLWAFSDDNTKENCTKQLTKNEGQPCKLTFDGSKEDTHDYCEMDYAAMDEETYHYQGNTSKSVDLKRRYSSTSHILLDASSSQDLSAFSSSTTLGHCKVSSQSSNHLPLCFPSSIPSVGLIERAQSCHTLTSQNKKSNAPSNMLGRFASAKIDPAPLLPTRSNLNLIAGSCKSVNQDQENFPCSTAQDDKQVDYDEISACEYTRLENPRKPPTPPKPTLAKLKALNQMGKELRCFVKTLCSTPSYRLAVRMTEEDCRVFRLVGDNTDLLEVFVDDDKSGARQHIADSVPISKCCEIVYPKAPNTSEVLEAWIRLAAFLVIDLGNAFSFGNILSALLEHELASKLLKMNKCSAQLLQDRVLPVYKQMCQPLNCPTDYLLPFIQPYFHLFSDYMPTNLTKAVPCGENIDERLALMCSFMKIARRMVCDKEDFQKRATQLIDRGSKECDFNTKNMFANDYLKLLGSGW